MEAIMEKRDVGLMLELICPKCRKELWQIAKREYHCGGCNTHYFGEEKKGPDGTSD